MPHGPADITPPPVTGPGSFVGSKWYRACLGCTWVVEDAKEGLISWGSPFFIFQRGKQALLGRGGRGQEPGWTDWGHPLPLQWASLGNRDFPAGTWGLAEQIQRFRRSQGWTRQQGQSPDAAGSEQVT